MSEGKKKNHLIVLIHGLWGSSQNMSRLESVIHHSLDESSVCKFHTYSPDCFSHFKTYDGVETIGDYIIPDLFNHLEKLSVNHNIQIDEISIIGYSLGGLIGRYIIGELYDIGFFDKIKPAFFTTFATPHLGVTFYKNRILNVLGTYLLGQTGKDLFMSENSNSIIYKLSDPSEKYYKSLNQFKKKICIANAKFDRTVGFYSAFITKYDIFNDWDTVDAKFIDELTTATLKENGKLFKCQIFDFNKSRRLDTPDKQSEALPSRKFALSIVMSIGFLLFPIIFSVSLFATVKSFFRGKILPKPEIAKQWRLTKNKVYNDDNNDQSSIGSNENGKLIDTQIDDDGYNESENMKSNHIGISHITREVVENGLNVISDKDNLSNLEEEEEENPKTTIDSNEIDKSYFIDLDFELEYSSKASCVKKLLENLDCSDLSEAPLSKNVEPLPFDDVRQTILENLNTIKWTKIGVLLHNLNAHQSVVGRRGFERTPDSIPLLFLYSFLIEDGINHP